MRLKSILRSISLAIICLQYQAPLQAVEDDAFFQDIDVVVTPVRLKQSPKDVPASVTVITHEQIQALGIRSIGEALRLVPGMIVGQAAGNDYRLEYGGTNGQTPRRMQVLVDGMSVFGTSFARVYWERFPVALEDIERIEVTRSPASAMYGANAMLAVINIITRHPEETPGLTFSTWYGSLSTHDTLLRYGGSIGNTVYRLTGEHEEDAGFDRNFTGIEDRRDGTDIDRFTAKSVTTLGDESTLSLHLGLLKGTLEDEFEESNQVSFPDMYWDNSFLIGTWNKSISDRHELQLKAYVNDWERQQRWRSCYPTLLLTPEMRALDEANPDFSLAIINGQIPSGGSAEDQALVNDVLGRIVDLGGLAGAAAPTCGDVNQDYTRTQEDFEIQDTFVFSDSLRAVSGIGIRRDETSSETYFSGERARNSLRIFANLEYKPNPKVTWNLGGMIEREDNVLEEPEFSPRVGLNYHLTDNQTIKFIVSKAIRTPDFVAGERDWNYLFRNLEPQLDGQDASYFFLRKTAEEAGDDNLKPERILAREIVYYVDLQQLGLTFDLKLYNNKLEDLISEDVSFFTIDYTNNESLRLKGFELQARYTSNNKFWTNLTYAHNDNNSKNFFETSIYARESGSFAMGYILNDRWSASLAYYAHLSDSNSFFDYHRTDAVLHYDTRMGQRNLKMAFIIRNQPKEQGAFAATETFTTRNLYDDDTHYYLNLEFDF